MDHNNIVNKYLKKLSTEYNYSEHTIIKYEMIYNKYLLFLEEKNIDLVNVSTKNIKDFIYQLYNFGYKSSTISNYISALKSLYKYLKEAGYTSENLMLNIKYPKREQRLYQIIYSEELKDFFKVLKEDEKTYNRNNALFLLLYSTGIRVSECTNLIIEDIDYDQKLIKVFGKGKKQRILPVSDEVLSKLILYINTTTNVRQDTNKIFLNNKGYPLTDRGIRYIIKKTCIKAGIISNVSPHKFRHTLATSLLNNGMDLRLVQEILGHESLSATQKYTHISTTKMQQIYDETVDRK